MAPLVESRFLEPPADDEVGEAVEPVFVPVLVPDRVLPDSTVVEDPVLLAKPTPLVAVIVKALEVASAVALSKILK